ncbi:matrix metalloproteinase-14-like protein [Dinothrombium tinctorium]|uniref:Matrix metalloproteinase-14-like protein n=1 Tax=Dinothrombium tinctorium TaxID=1965070 RepID=A0A3S3NTQ7_9ACAR|nr:matrix metalloproteinase-14-like protein [Dinothrombium tinctorium]RWS03608.1 matrix metalloproteinase-14-like protein [Dinothrombium tinctorium]
MQRFNDSKVDPTEPEKSDDDICSSTEFDAATTINNVTYLFRGEYFFTIDSTGSIERKGRKISDEFPNIPSDLDAAVTTRDGITYFFKGDQYYQAGGRRGESAPRPIHSHFRNVPNDLDAAFVYSKDGLIYFVKDKKFIRFENEGVQLSEEESHSIGFNLYLNNLKAVYSSKSNNFFLYDWFYYRLGEQGWVQEQNNIDVILKCDK